ncbi:hypothetical protein WBJ53_22950 [Spirosoma sp. SC4-14]|uniref:hypothetical protein n=1 Tax=Spirosoma sp. SC4-14 TaxID=3128900 RepID=UPI0030CC633A
MATLLKSILQRINGGFLPSRQPIGPILQISLLVALSACSSDKPSGAPKRVKLSVGEIQEISLSDRGSNSMQLIGTSDNEEIVAVSRPDLAPAVDTLNRAQPAKAVFQLKGITAGTANVTFTEKAPNDPGPGQIRKIVSVRVSAK